MGVLAWATESALIGLWGWALSASLYPNGFHLFVSRSHLIISCFTVAVQLVASAHKLPLVAHTAAEAFACCVFGLFTMYLVVILDQGRFKDPLYFSLPMVGDFLPMDACIGLGWFGTALVSAIGMGLSDKKRSASLMFHPTGYHMLIMPPAFLLFWLYSRVMLYALAGLWLAFIALQFASEGVLLGQGWPDVRGMTLTEISAMVLKFLGCGACVASPAIALLYVKTNAQTILFSILVGIGAVHAIDWPLLMGMVSQNATSPYASRSAHTDSTSHAGNTNHHTGPEGTLEPSAPAQYLVFPGSTPAPHSTSHTSHFWLDPAAVALEIKKD